MTDPLVCVSAIPGIGHQTARWLWSKNGTHTYLCDLCLEQLCEEVESDPDLAPAYFQQIV